MKYLLIVLMMTSAMFAQAPDGEKPAFPPLLERFLGLAEGQAGAIVDANEQFENDPILKEKVETLRQLQSDLSQALNEEFPNAGAIGALAVDTEMLDRELRAEREAFQQEMIEGILGFSGDDEEPSEVVKRLNMLERAKKLEPIYEMAVRFRLVDTPRQMRQQRKEGADAPEVE